MLLFCDGHKWELSLSVARMLKLRSRVHTRDVWFGAASQEDVILVYE